MPDYSAIAASLPTEQTPEAKAKRAALFKQFDPNGNGYLSLAEVDKGLQESCGLDAVYKCKPAIIRAFNAAKGLKKNGVKDQADDYVTKIEFRMLLVFLKQYFELFQIFDGIDQDDDRRIDIDEFTAAAPQLKAWGMDISDDPRLTFDEIDNGGGQAAAGGGKILFIEFSEWAIKKNLLKNVHDDDE